MIEILSSMTGRLDKGRKSLLERFKFSGRMVLARTAVFMFILSAGSKVVGFLRETFLASFFGANYVVDSFVLAYNIPNIIFGALFTALTAAFLPLYSSFFSRDLTGRDSNLFASQMIKILVLIALIGAIWGVVFSEEIVHFVAPGLGTEAADLTRFYFKITLLFMVLTNVSTILEGILNFKGVFLPQMGLDYVQNFAFILAIYLASIFDQRLLVAGLGTGYVIRALFLLKLAKRTGFQFLTESIQYRKTLFLVLPLALPVLVGGASQQLTLFVNRQLLSTLPEGRVSALYFANQANNIVLTMGITILTTIIYPYLLQATANKNWTHFAKLCQRGFDITCLIVIPSALGCIIFRKDIIGILYQRGAFDIEATLLTSGAFFYYSFGLVFLGLNDLVLKAFYAMGLMKFVMFTTLLGSLSTIGLSYLFLPKLGHGGLALAYSCGAAATAIMLMIRMLKYFKLWGVSFSFRIAWISTLVSCIAISSAALLQYLAVGEWSKLAIPSFLISVLVAVCLYFLGLRILKVHHVVFRSFDNPEG